MEREYHDLAEMSIDPKGFHYFHVVVKVMGNGTAASVLDVYILHLLTSVIKAEECKEAICNLDKSDIYLIQCMLGQQQKIGYQDLQKLLDI
ncbi:hypothetical protein RIR_jg23434.t1 [Rhizophagus irregularis DAOM 181602=DAOM 197198]|nr:hypothetical protein RIR_jg23434.t1 [Rhizophagus irregularis DAOM 181602=DAOM 197198]